MVIFGLMTLILMMAAGGMAVDIMRYEANRTKLQNTLDRAVLAAASLDQTLDPKVVVTDYFNKAGLRAYNLDVEVKSGLNFREVTATSSMEVPSLFLGMVGVDSITAPARGSAIERILNVEVSMVLDISGSMGGWSPTGGATKLSLMQGAARTFVDTVLTEEQQHLVSVSLIPYNGRVNAGSVMAQYFPLSGGHTFSNCVRFSDEQFQRTRRAPGESFERLGHFDRETGNNPNMTRPHCQSEPTTASGREFKDYGAIVPWSNNPDTLKTAINGLQADGWTAIDLGMKWASILLDSDYNSELSAMVSDSRVSTHFATRPAAYTDRETIKVVVLMTDGTNTNQYDLKSEYKTGLSNVFRYVESNGTVRYSYYMPETDTYRDPNDNNDYSAPWGDDEAVRLTYAQLWASHPVRYVADSIYDLNYAALDTKYGRGWQRRHLDARDRAAFDWHRNIRNAAHLYAGASVANQRLDWICTATKSAGDNVVIFTIGFEAPDASEAVLRKCASTDSHYYDVNGLEIDEAFTAIARTINQLRLTQ